LHVLKRTDLLQKATDVVVLVEAEAVLAVVAVVSADVTTVNRLVALAAIPFIGFRQ
jgi:hypothetical protein